MPELSQPQLGRKPNIPPVVPLDQAPSDKKDEYKDLFEAAKEAEAGDPVAPTHDDTQPKPVDPLTPKPTEPEISPEDKLAFVESILGEKPYAKSYKLFGDKVDATFQDRTVEDSEAVYKQLDEDYEKGAIKSDEQWQVALERYQMAAGLQSFVLAGSKGAFDMGGSFQERLTRLMTLPTPVYRALMAASRKFEEEVNFLVGKADDPDFWAADG